MRRGRVGGVRLGGVEGWSIGPASFAHCERIGVAHPDLLPEELTVRDLLEWEAYDRNVGSPARREQARLLALLYNVNRRKGQDAKTEEDFLVGFDPNAEGDSTPAELLCKLTEQLGLTEKTHGR